MPLEHLVIEANADLHSITYPRWGFNRNQTFTGWLFPLDLRRHTLLQIHNGQSQNLAHRFILLTDS